jgi:spermidine/putrescine transport system substrate-binding protein
MKKLLKLIMILFASMFIISGCKDKPKLHVYTWADYIDPDLIQKFEQENNCKVEIDTFDSNETLFAKLMAGASGYDIIMPTEYFIPTLIDANLIEKLDTNKLSNVSKNFDEKYKSKWSFIYDIPYAFSCTGILYRKDKCPDDLKFLDWNDLLDPRLKGRVCIMNDIREILGLALKMNGYSVNSKSYAELSEAVIIARRWKAACSKMDSEAYRIGIPSAEFSAAMAYNSDAIQLIAEGNDYVEFSIPTNGTTSSVDTFCITKSAKNKELAYKFIDMCYSMSNAVRNSEYIGAPMPVKGLFEALSDKYKNISIMNVTDELKNKCEDIQDIGNDLDMYSKAWDRVKAK